MTAVQTSIQDTSTSLDTAPELIKLSAGIESQLDGKVTHPDTAEGKDGAKRPP